jgi:hypothetical protein
MKAMTEKREPSVDPVYLFITERWAWEKRPLNALCPNIIATKLAEIVSKAGSPQCPGIGDSIDRGLIALRLLNEAGFELWIKDAEEYPIAEDMGPDTEHYPKGNN